MQYRFVFSFALFYLGMVSMTLGQSTQPLTMYKTFGGIRYEYRKDTNVYNVSPKQVLNIVGDDPLAFAEFKKARTNSTVAGLMGFLGAVMIAIPLASAIGGSEPEWGYAASGATLIIGSIPFNNAYKRRSQNACDIYNGKHTVLRPQMEYHFAGLGGKIVVKF